jgi:hypothetical protein
MFVTGRELFCACPAGIPFGHKKFGESPLWGLRRIVAEGTGLASVSEVLGACQIIFFGDHRFAGGLTGGYRPGATYGG